VNRAKVFAKVELSKWKERGCFQRNLLRCDAVDVGSPRVNVL
jgi:hypothetical protein